MGLWLLLPGTQLSLTLRSCGSDSSRSVGGSGRSLNRHADIEQTRYINAEMRIISRGIIPITIRRAEADLCSSSVWTRQV